MNLPWLPEYAALQGRAEMVKPMIAQCAVFGGLLGMTSASIRCSVSVERVPPTEF